MENTSMYELYSAVIRHAGNRTFEIVKANLTAPEIIILRAVHGADSVVNIKRTGKRDFKSHKDGGDWALLTNAGELDRLRGAYKDFIIDDDKSIVDTLWPGFNPQLPVFLEELAAVPTEKVA
jgi:hypothetical protein